MKRTLVALSLFLFSCLCTNRHEAPVEFEKKIFIADSVEYHSLQQDNIAQVDPYTRVHLKGTDVWLQMKGFVCVGQEVQVFVVKK